jgi:hypothetical protein
MIDRTLLAGLLLSVAMVPALAQPAPFDMTPESGLVPPAPIPTVPVPVEVTPEPAPAVHTRYLLPTPTVRLAGEESRHAIVFYLTQAEAESAARLSLNYLNAVMVAPEFSSLGFSINQTSVSRTPIAASSARSAVSVGIPAGLLRPGPNILEIHASQRHRTDCTIQSTYELWTDLTSDGLQLHFDSPEIAGISQLADLAAVGVGVDGHTRLRVLAGDLGDAQTMSAALRLIQQMAIALRVADPRIEIVDALSATAEPGVLDVVIGTAQSLPAELAEMSGAAASGPLVTMASLASGAPTLVLSGPDWASIARSGNDLVAAAPASSSRPRVDLGYPVPLMEGGSAIELAALGANTVEFNGRRFTTRFQFELPPDFYSYRYGNAELALDAAYSSDVQPGSEIDIYTNGQIASATPLLQTDGGLLRNTIIRVPMTNLRPGRNEVDIAVNLNTTSDQACPVGWTGDAPTRFVFSGSSKLRLPEYARAAALPDLRLLTGAAWPYVLDEDVPIAVGQDTESETAALTLAARLATASGKITPLTVTSDTQLAADRNVLVVKPVASITGDILARTGLSDGRAGGIGRDASVLDQFASETIARPLPGALDWFLDRVGLQIDDLRVLPERDQAVGINNSVVLAQARQSEGGIWTVLTAADGPRLVSGINQLVETRHWREINGRASTIAPTDETITATSAANPVLDVTSFSLTNLRLVAANWFSANILMFTALITAACVLLMIATSLMLKQLGRRQ